MKRDCIIATYQQMKFQAIATVRELVAEPYWIARCSIQPPIAIPVSGIPTKVGVTAPVDLASTSPPSKTF